MSTLKLFLLIRWAWFASSFFTWAPWRSILSRTCNISTTGLQYDELPDSWARLEQQVWVSLTSFMVTDSLRLLSSSLLTVLEVWMWLLDSLVISAWIPLTTPSISTWCIWNIIDQWLNKNKSEGEAWGPTWIVSVSTDTIDYWGQSIPVINKWWLVDSYILWQVME